MRGLSRIGLVVAVVTAPLACASAPQDDAGALRVPGSQRGPLRTRQQVMDRDRALIAGLATSLAFGIVGLWACLDWPLATLGASVQGSHQVFTRQANDQLITAFGDARPAAVKAIANSLARK